MPLSEDASDLDFAAPRTVDPDTQSTHDALYAGVAFMHGFERPQNSRRAAICLRFAAEAGQARAKFLLGRLQLELPEGDRAEGIHMLEQAAEQSQHEAFALLGQVYEEGTVLLQDLPRAIEYYQRGVEHGCVDSHRRLGALLLRDEDSHANRCEGLRLLEVAAESGDAQAQYALSIALSRGRVEHRNLSRALVWATRASRSRKTQSQVH